MSQYKFEILSKKKRCLKFRIQNVDLSIINSVRRIILSEIPNVAVSFDSYDPTMSDITFMKNTTVLHNEMLGHRLSLIPINLTQDEIVKFNEKCKNYTYVINKKNNTDKVMLVTTEDITISNGNTMLSEAERSRILPVNPFTKHGILINKLHPNNHNNALGEEMHVEMKTRIDIARTHARWSPVSTCTFFNTIDETLVDAELELALDGVEDESEIKKIKNNFKSIERYRLYHKNKYGEPYKLDMNIETECILEPQYLFCKALDILNDKLTDLISKPNKYAINEIDNENNIYNIIIENENNTLANMLQSLIYNRYCREGRGVKYIGYHIPHPLEDRVVFKVIIDDAEFKSVDILLKTAVPYIQNMLTEIKNTFLSTVNVE